jgi:hypothetical protein
MESDAPGRILNRMAQIRKRPLAKAGILLLLGLWCLGPLGSLAHLAGHVHSHVRHSHARAHEERAPSDVEAQRIEVAASPAPVCHHHPEGCPADCHCPKIVPEPLAPGQPIPAGESMREPSLVQCTEGGPQAKPPALVACWLPEIPGLREPFPSESAAWPALSASPLDPDRDPPGHVPRSRSPSA